MGKETYSVSLSVPSENTFEHEFKNSPTRLVRVEEIKALYVKIPGWAVSGRTKFTQGSQLIDTHSGFICVPVYVFSTVVFIHDILVFINPVCKQAAYHFRCK